jgi:DNA (cytosine-5)-methyltransferase 1
VKPALRFYDFFAGAGLATLALRGGWQCVWANDIAPAKAAVYKANFGGSHFIVGDVAKIRAGELPRPAEMAWASFPCQDLSLAGWRRGLAAERSGAFWAFWRIMRDLQVSGERPPMLVIENVPGLLYGDSFTGLCEAVASLGMQFGALVIDARWFVPQSRPRIFLIAVDESADCSALSAGRPPAVWAPAALLKASERLPDELKTRWRWWQLPVPVSAPAAAAGLLEEEPALVEWHTPEQTRTLLEMMNGVNRVKIVRALRRKTRQAGFLYRRMRNGVQRAEVRFDGIAGCLRTPRGGSSRQTVVVVENGVIRTRLLSPREAARLMGVPDSFVLPPGYNDAYQAMGDGVVAPAVSWLSDYLLRPLARVSRAAGAGRVAHSSPCTSRAESVASHRMAVQRQKGLL